MTWSPSLDDAEEVEEWLATKTAEAEGLPEQSKAILLDESFSRYSEPGRSLIC